TGSVAAVQRFGGALHLHPHLHALQVDGAFTKVGAGVRFHEATPPTKDDVATGAQRVRDRAVRWLSRHGFVDERAAEERGNPPAEPSALEGCMQLALAGGTFLARPAEAKPDPTRTSTTRSDASRRPATGSMSTVPFASPRRTTRGASG